MFTILNNFDSKSICNSLKLQDMSDFNQIWCKLWSNIHKLAFIELAMSSKMKKTLIFSILKWKNEPPIKPHGRPLDTIFCIKMTKNTLKCSKSSIFSWFLKDFRSLEFSQIAIKELILVFKAHHSTCNVIALL